MSFMKDIRRNQTSFGMDGKYGILLGSDGDKYYVNGDDTHTLTIGATRSGKSRCIVLPSIGILGLGGESMVISDPKGELHQYTYPYLKRLGYEVYAMDFKNPERSDHYNFLQEVIDAVNNNDMPRAQKKALDITEALVENDMTAEKIWTEGEKLILAACIIAVVYDNRKNPEYQNLTNVYYFINYMCELSDNPPLKRYVDDISISDPNHPVLAFISATKVAPGKTQGSFNISALATLRLFADINVYNITNRSSFNVIDLGRKKMALFMILPDYNTTYYGVASLMVDQIYSKLTETADLRGGRLKNRVNFVLDEFGNFTVIPDFSVKLTVGGGRGIRFNLFVQSMAQLEGNGKKIKYVLLDKVKELLFNNEIKILILNGKSDVSSEEYSIGSNIIIGGNTLGRGVTFPRLQTIYYTRTSKKPQADTMWQHSRMFGYDRDKGMIKVFIDKRLYKLFADINATNNSIIAQIEKGIKDIKMYYPSSLSPTRKNVLDNGKLYIISGGTNYYPMQTDNDSVEELSELLKSFSENESYYQVSLNLLKNILSHITPSSDFKISAYQSILTTLLSEKPVAQGILIVRRGRKVTQGTGALLSPADWKIGGGFPKGVVLTMYQIEGERGWKSPDVWVPNIRFPDNIVYYDIQEE